MYTGDMGLYAMGIKWHLQGKDGPLTDSQMKYLKAIVDWQDRWDETPTCRQLADALKVTPGGVNNMVQLLRNKGFLGKGYRGMIEVTEKGRLATGGTE